MSKEYILSLVRAWCSYFFGLYIDDLIHELGQQLDKELERIENEEDVVK